MKDHRELGRQLELFFFDEVAPGAPFWLPKGLTVVKILEQYLHELYRKENLQEISTPILVKRELWATSGHWQKFRDNMFTLKDGKQDYALKPMNCPGSALVYQAKTRSYKDLPLRLAEIGVLHRREVSGAVGGLFRVRQLTMDDAHIYCRPEQLQQEITAVLRQIRDFHKLFDFKGEYFLATKPDEAMGDPKLWDQAERALAKALKSLKIKYTLKPKDGAFYGPKIDINVKDAHKRDWTISTVQLDFQIPERFELEYADDDGKSKRPVIIHRAIFGTFERFIGILLEHTQGELPLWLTPVQAVLATVSDEHISYAQKAVQKLSDNRVRVTLDDSAETVSKKVRNAELRKTPYIIVVGEKERKSDKLTVRGRLGKQHAMSVDELISLIAPHRPFLP